MSTLTDRRTRKRLATREAISNAATRLFMDRGFDRVTMEEIAEAADVGRMTVFNHFPRKEDLFFDLEEEGRDVLREALLQRAPDVSPIEALRRLAHRLVLEEARYLHFIPGSRRYVETAQASETLKSRARAIRDELAHEMASGLARSVGRDASDLDAQLAAAWLLASWTTAFIQAHHAYRETTDPERAKAVFTALVDRGTAGLNAALRGTPYV